MPKTTWRCVWSPSADCTGWCHTTVSRIECTPFVAEPAVSIHKGSDTTEAEPSKPLASSAEADPRLHRRMSQSSAFWMSRPSSYLNLKLVVGYSVGYTWSVRSSRRQESCRLRFWRREGSLSTIYLWLLYNFLELSTSAGCITTPGSVEWHS